VGEEKFFMAKTPQRVIDLLKSEIPGKISRNQFCIKTGINQNSIDKYMAGVAEPTLASLEKISEYFDAPVEWLMGYDDEDMRIIIAKTEEIGDALHNLHNKIGSDYKELIEIELAYAAIYDVAINRLFTKDGKDILIENQRLKLQTMRDKTHAILNEIPLEEFPKIAKRLAEKYPDGNIPKVKQDDPIKQLRQIASKRKSK
jgi:transcriptional regulator with XRE-family HTH domain